MMNIRTALLLAADSIEKNPDMYNFNSLEEVLGFNTTTKFYNRIESLSDGMWTIDAGCAVKALRLYADKYHPEESTSAIPESVMAIFNTEVCHVDID